MRTSWPSLHCSLTRSIGTLPFQRQFKALCATETTLERFCEPAALLDHLHARDGEPAAKNEILKALTRALGGRNESAATTLLWLALWPGLDALFRRLLQHSCSPEDLVSDIADRFTGEINRIDLTRVRRLAATVLRNVERDIRQSLSADLHEGIVLCELTEEFEAGSDPSVAPYRSLLDLPLGVDLDTGAAIICERLQRCIGDDATLVVTVAVQGDTQREAADRLGLDHDVARKRYQRSLRRLRRKIAALD